MYHFIINPNARSGLGHKVWTEIETILKEREISYEKHFTKYQRHATEIVRTITADGEPHTLVALGGDGTVNEVVNGITDFSKVTLGYIPIGSSNDFARYFRFPKDPLKALEMILAARSFRHMNVGILNYGDSKRRCFAVSTGLGFDAAACHEAVVSKIKLILNKLKLGKLTYVCIALRQLILTTPKDMTVILDDNKELSFKNVLFAAAMNHPYEGGGCKFCPKADPCDDKLDVIVVSDVSKLKVLLVLPTAFFGHHVHFKGVYIYTCKNASFHSDRALAAHTDGEPVFLQRNVRISLASEKVRIITG